MIMARYSELKKQYPEFISKEQLWKIAKICKEHAKWLLDEGVIPCENSGKTTRKYKIALKDVIRYLQLRDQGKVPKPVFDKRGNTKLIEVQNKAIEAYPADYAKHLFNGAPDVLTTKQFCAYTGMSYDAALQRIRWSIIPARQISAQYYILKTNAAKYIASYDYVKYLRVIKKYQYVYGAFAE